ncbi:relaxase/mobilization nuclease domain-containing protein [Asticcacaulis benevestitus]|uniref:relaxase/mobilization nuclease domain-containing protein n=1 Tax=Asticcacaulis benevestitus TaxID=347481 RepID=UPI0039B72A08
MGLEDHQRVIVFHRKDGREHCHVVWNRIDADTLLAAHHSHNCRIHEQVARSLERESGLNRTQGVHVEREGEMPKDRRPTCCAKPA